MLGVGYLHQTANEKLILANRICVIYFLPFTLAECCYMMDVFRMTYVPYTYWEDRDILRGNPRFNTHSEIVDVIALTLH